MEALALIAILVGVAILAAPFMAYAALRRSSRLQEDIDELKRTIAGLEHRAYLEEKRIRRGSAYPEEAAEPPPIQSPLPTDTLLEQARKRREAGQPYGGAAKHAEPVLPPEPGVSTVPPSETPASTPAEEKADAQFEQAPIPELARERSEGLPEAALETDLETRLGTTWALRIGLVLLAVCAGLVARLISPMLGPAGKVAIAYLASMALFGFGKIYERRLRAFALPVMAAGLSFAFFVSYAAHFVAPMNCISLYPSLAWMSGGVAAMFLFAERTKSQFAAGLGIFLGHAAAFVAAGEADAFSLVAISFLSLAAVLMFLRHRWHALSIFAVVASYGSHMAWLFAEHAPSPPERSFWVNLAFLSSYYFIFLASDLIQWREEAAIKGDEEGTRKPIGSGRALGPVNLLLYISAVCFIHVGTAVYRAEIHWFLFGVGALQVLLGFYYRRCRNEDYAFYPAFGVIVATLGLFSAFEAMTLSLVLALEALMLLLAAHRTRIWLFHLLAQAALALNFIHYWTTGGTQIPTPQFLGGLTIVGVYYVKASLEEIWYAPGARIEWDRGTGAMLRPFSTVFDKIFTPIAPFIAPLHAMGGSVILTRLLLHFLTLSDAPLAGGIGILVLAALALARRSLALSFGWLALAAGFLVVHLSYGQGMSRLTGEIAVWDGWGLACLVGVSCGAFAALIPRQWPGTEARSEAVGVGQFGGLISITLLLSCAVILPRGHDTFLPFAALCWLAFGQQDLMTTAMRGCTPPKGAAALPFKMSLPVASVLTAGALLAFAIRGSGSGYAMPVWGATFAAALTAAAAIRRNSNFLLGAFFLWCATHAMTLGGTSTAHQLLDHGLWTAWVCGLTLAAAVAQDFFLTSRGKELGEPRRLFGEAATMTIYSLGLITASAYFERAIPNWRLPAGAGLALIIAATCGSLRMRCGVVIAWAAIIVAHILALKELSLRIAIPDERLIPLAILGLETMAFERFLALGSGIEYRFEGKNPTPAARIGLMVGMIVLVLTVFECSEFFGTRWTTAGWTLTGLLLMGLGFWWRSGLYRRSAMILLIFCIARIFLVDTAGLSLGYKTLAYAALGLCLVAVSFLYSRFYGQVRKWL